jgi:O-antigen/teichoic acid export membrane protein
MENQGYKGKGLLDSSLKLLAKTSIIVFIGVFLSKVLTYLYRIIIARYFGPEVYGLFSLAIMIAGWFVAFSSLGLYDGIIRFISLYRGKKELNKIKSLFKISFAFLSLSSIAFGIFLFYSSNFISVTIFHNSDLILFLKIFSFLIPFTVISYPFLSVLRAYEEIGWHSFVFNIIQNLTKLIFLLFFIFLGMKSEAVAFSHTIGALCMLLFSYYICKYKVPQLFGKSNLTKKERKPLIKDLFIYSIPLLFSAIINILFTWVDSFSIGYFKSALEVGFYNAAVPIAMILTIIPDLFMQLFFPMITKEYSKKNFGLIKELSKQVNKWIFIILLPATILLSLFPGAAINILFGSEYLVAETALRFLTLGMFFYCLFIVSNNLLSMAGKSNILLINVTILAVINAILNFILVPKYGINGAAFSTMFCYIIFGIILLFESNYYISIIPLKRKMLKVLLVSLVPLFILLFVRKFILINLLNLFILTITFLLLYVLLMFITGCLDKNDILILTTIKKKIFRDIS